MTNSVIIQGGREIFFGDPESHNVGDGALANVLISVDGKYVFKSLKSSDGKDEFQILRDLREKLPPDSEARKLLMRAFVVERHPFTRWMGAQIHVQDCAPGKDLATYRAEGSLPFSDRLHIALQTTLLFKEAQEAGFAYNDHKPENHIFWDAENRIAKVIDWNAATIKPTPAEEYRNFVDYCLALPKILDVNPYEYKSERGGRFYYLDANRPLNWSLHVENLGHHRTTGYRAWFILALTALTVTGTPFVKDWDELLRVLNEVKDGKTLWLEEICARYVNRLTAVGDAGKLIGKLLNSDTPTSDQANLADNLSGKLLKSAQAYKTSDEIVENFYQEVLECLLLARLLNPASFQIFCAFEVWRLFLANPMHLGLRNLFLNLKNVELKDYDPKLGEGVAAFPDLMPLTKLRNLAAKRVPLQAALNLPQDKRFPAISDISNKGEDLDLDVLTNLLAVASAQKIQENCNKTLDNAQNIIKNTGNIAEARTKIEKIQNTERSQMPDDFWDRMKRFEDELAQLESKNRSFDEMVEQVNRMLAKGDLALTLDELNKVVKFVESFTGNVADEKRQKGLDNLLNLLGEKRDAISIRENKLRNINAANRLEDWFQQLKEAAKSDPRAELELLKAENIVSINNKIINEKGKINPEDINSSIKSLEKIQADIESLKEQQKDDEVSVKFIKQLDKETIEFQKSILNRSLETVRGWLANDPEVTFVKAKKILDELSSAFGKKSVADGVDLLEQCRLIVEIKYDPQRWGDLPVAISSLPDDVLLNPESDYYSDLKSRAETVSQAEQLLRINPLTWTEDVENLARKFENRKEKLTPAEHQAYEQVKDTIHKARSAAEDEIKLEQLADAQETLSKNIEALQSALNSRIAGLEQAVKNLLNVVASENKEIVTTINVLQGHMINPNDLELGINRLDEETKKRTQELQNYVSAKSDVSTLRMEIAEIKRDNEGLQNIIPTRSDIDTWRVEIRGVAKQLSNLQEEFKQEVKELETKIVHQISRSIEQSVIGAHSKKTPDDDKKIPPLDEDASAPEFAEDLRKLFKDPMAKYVFGSLFVGFITVIIFIAGIWALTTPSVMARFSVVTGTPNPTPTATSTELPTATPTFIVTPSPVFQISLKDTANPVMALLDDESEMLKLYSAFPENEKIDVVSVGEERADKALKKVKFIAGLRILDLVDIPVPVAELPLTIKPKDEKSVELSLFCLDSTNAAFQCGSYLVAVGIPATTDFAKPESGVFPQDYVWLEWTVWVKQDALSQ